MSDSNVNPRRTPATLNGRENDRPRTTGRPQHIALFMPALSGGGAERIMLTLAERFHARGHRVDLVLTRAKGAYKNEVPDGVRVVDLNARRIIASLPALKRYLRRERPPVLLSALSSTNIVALWARAIARVETKVVVAEHSTLSQSSAHADSARDRWMPLLMKACYSRADAIVCVSGGVADDLSRTLDLPRDRLHVIYNPIDTSALTQKAAEPLGHPWFAQSETPVFLAVGRLIAAKDFGTLLRAFAHVRQSCSARLVILGEGKERPALEALVRELRIVKDVSLPGFAANPYQYMKRATVFVLSSRWEGLPTVLVEAMACGTPVISTDCPSGPSEILEGGRWGKLVPVGDWEALSRAMQMALKELSPGPIQRVRHFTAERAVNQYLFLVDRVRSGTVLLSEPADN